MLDRSVPLWLFLLTLLLLLMFMVVFGWAVSSTRSGSDRTGAFGRAAVMVASLPTYTRLSFLELEGHFSGKFQDRNSDVPRDPGLDLSAFKAVDTAQGIGVEGLRVRTGPGEPAPGWRVLVGAFRIDGEVEHAALLLSPDLQVVRRWILNEIPVGDLKPLPPHRVFVHGFEILADGSVIFAFDEGVSLQKFDACGRRDWITAGLYHHAVTLDDSAETVWTLEDRGPKAGFAQVRVQDGALLRRIPVTDVIAANQMTDVLKIRHNSDDLNPYADRWLTSPFHFNDIDPLPAALAERFAGFEAGDLLISARSLNLVFVMDPDTRKIKWWRSGVTRRQHDPDWLPNGQILVFNNRMDRDFSEILAIDPVTMDTTTLLDGRDLDFYSRIRGKVQSTDSGDLVITSPQQGRAFELTAAGEVALEFINTKADTDDTSYVVSELKWLPLDYFDGDGWECTLQN